MNRRNFFKSMISLAVASVVAPQLLAETTTQFSLETAKLSRPETFINILDFGDIDDINYDWTHAIRAAINKADITGETIYFPAGTYHIHPVPIFSHQKGINLQSSSLHKGTKIDIL